LIYKKKKIYLVALSFTVIYGFCHLIHQLFQSPNIQVLTTVVWLAPVLPSSTGHLTQSHYSLLTTLFTLIIPIKPISHDHTMYTQFSFHFPTFRFSMSRDPLRLPRRPHRLLQQFQQRHYYLWEKRRSPKRSHRL